MVNVKTYAYGFPRIGKNREYKKFIEKFWAKKITQEELITQLWDIESDMEKTYSEVVDSYPTNEMTMYDKMLDTAIMVGLYSTENTKEYYELCRGKNALEMTKWFNTNYHYLVPDFSKWDKPQFKIQGGINNSKNPYFIGPFTFLKLSKGIPEDKFREYALQLAEVYKDIISKYDTVHFDEPAFTMDLGLENKEVYTIKEMYDILAESDASINVFTYFFFVI